MAKNFYPYTVNNEKLWGYERQYKGHQLRKKGFTLKSDAEIDLRQSMDDIDDAERGIVRAKPTTAQEAHEIYKRQLTVKARDKDYSYALNNKYILGICQQFVDHFGPRRLIRECIETDLLEFYQILCFGPNRHKSTARTLIARVQGMLTAAQKTKPDLGNWQHPTLIVSKGSKFERRVVEPWEYATLVKTLQDPPWVPVRHDQRKARWRDAADAVQLLRMSGGRLNEILRMKLDQFMWKRKTFRLHATKTENERDLPLWDPVVEVIQNRIKDGLTGEEYIFARATTMTYDKLISRACRQAGKVAKLSYGRANGFTCHSFRHTFITDMMEATNKDIKLVMSWSGHKSLESFQIYLHPTEEGRILGAQQTNSVADFLRTYTGAEGAPGATGAVAAFAKPLRNKQVAV